VRSSVVDAQGRTQVPYHPPEPDHALPPSPCNEPATNRSTDWNHVCDLAIANLTLLPRNVTPLTPRLGGLPFGSVPHGVSAVSDGLESQEAEWW
jgi:hypothetical protein